MRTAESTRVGVPAGLQQDGTALLPSERKSIHGLYVVICLIITAAATFFHHLSLMEQDRQHIARAHAVFAALDTIFSAVHATESAISAQALIGNEAFPEPDPAVERAIGQKLDRLKILVADDSLQASRAAKLSDLIAQQLEQARFLARLRDSRKPLDDNAFAAIEGEKRAYVGVRRIAKDMRSAETASLQESRSQSEHTASVALAAAFLSIVSTAIAAIGISRHFTRHRRARTALRQANVLLAQRIVERTVALRKAQAHLRLSSAAFDNVQESIIITTLDYRIVAVNPAFSAITEYPRDEVIGQHLRTLRFEQQEASFYEDMLKSITATGRWQGELWNRRRSGEIHQVWLSVSTIRDTADQPLYYIGVAADLSRMNHAKSHLEYLAHHDPLTGLPNRLLLQLRLRHTIARATRNDAMCAVLFLDLDHFKPVNDTLGHAAGDELLKLASARMRERLRDIDTLARIGGDEFVIVLEEVCSHENAAAIAHALIEQLSSPFLLSGGQQVNIGASIGISTYPYDATHPDELLERADTALYAAKQAGRGTWHFATPPKEAARPDHARMHSNQIFIKSKQ